ncbi:MAG: hypothetical protein ACXWV2_03935 [Chitinophagaceae bacterium]
MKRKINLLFLLIICLAIGAFYFIKLNNDHLECDVSTVETKNKNGEIVRSTAHICHERFPL